LKHGTIARNARAVNNHMRALGASATLTGAACVLMGCPSTATTTGYTPITGIVIRSSALVAGYGCGTGPSQVYRYAAIVYFAADGGAQATLVANVFDCFTDGVFENLPVADGGGQDFIVSIRAYNFASFPRELQCLPTGGPCAAQDPMTLLADAARATWATTCAATQQQGIPVLAVCQPLAPQEAGTDAESDSMAAVEAGAMADAKVDATAEAGAMADAEAGAVADAEAGAVADAEAGAGPDAKSPGPDATSD
jgi:hypothetical protein